MPELPEVETIVRELNESDLIGTRIVDVKVYWHRTIATHSLETFCKSLVNQMIKKIERRGKYIVFTLSKDFLIIHLRMTGKLILTKSFQTPTSHERVLLKLDDGRYLHFEDQRKFGKWYLEQTPDIKLSKLGLEPLSDDFTLIAFQEMLQKSTTTIKAFLLNQSHIVGIGNIYADEAIWMAKIHPEQKANTLKWSQINSLHKSISEVLLQGIANTGTTLGSKNANYYSVSGRRGRHQDHLNVFRREGKSCPRCGTEIIKIRVAQRGTHLCPNCQKYHK